ncbi:MAG: serine/threonine protein kinase [Chitinophagaceae bacterium]|nr:serine/threonine protein kinase [Chitinophagaceae bacterium]
MKYDSGHITEIAGYRLTERIGSGGMGDVYKATNAALNRTAAIKILHQKGMAERFRNEAYIQSSVSHPNIACLYEYLVSGETACIIMEYVEGDPLDVYLHKRGKLSNEETANIIKQIAAALAYLHGKGILHRDIKPQNFKIQPSGTVTMLDFGIAKNKYTPKLTQQGYIVGTTEYLAPEQFQQRPEKKSDVWSLGVLTYELLTGFMPFDADNPVTMRYKIEKGEFTKPRILVPGISDKLNTVIEKCLQVNPLNRSDAADIEMLLGDKKPIQVQKTRGELARLVNKKTISIAAVAGLLILTVLFIPKDVDKNQGKEASPGQKEKTDQGQPAVELQKLTIDVPNASDAIIVFPDGSSKKLPYDIVGKEGENFQFTLQAEGYVSKKIEVPITVGRRSYEYNLEKIKE